MHGNVLHSIVAILLVAGIAFLFTTVAANAIAIVGTNPVSGMTLMTLILASVVMVAVGLKGATGMVAALVMGGVVCTALSMAGGFITDLKIGYWLGSTPAKQETWKFLGTLVSAATVGGVIMILNKTYGFHRRIGSSAGQRDGSRNRPVDERCRRSLAALRNRRRTGIGADLLQSTRTGFCAGYVHSTGIEPAVAGRRSGELVCHYPQQRRGGERRTWREGNFAGIRIHSRRRIDGVVSAAMRFGGINLVNEEWLSNPLSEVLSIVAYILLIIWLVKASMHIKKNNPFSNTVKIKAI